MQSTKDKTVFITGASSGIGQGCAWRFAESGARLLLCARRRDRLEKLAEELKVKFNTPTYLMTLDVRIRDDVQKAIKEIPDDWSEIDILVNNAGLASGLDKMYRGDIDDWEKMIDTNIKGLLYITRAVIPGMVDRGKGDIINIGSIAGHEVYPNGSVYCGSKHAVDAITRGLRMDLIDTPLRVCTVDPGLVETEFSKVRFHGDESRANSVYKGLEPLKSEDIADAVYYCASRPPQVQIAEIVIFPTAQKSATIVSRDND